MSAFAPHRGKAWICWRLQQESNLQSSLLATTIFIALAVCGLDSILTVPAAGGGPQVAPVESLHVPAAGRLRSVLPRSHRGFTDVKRIHAGPFGAGCPIVQEGKVISI